MRLSGMNGLTYATPVQRYRTLARWALLVGVLGPSSVAWTPEAKAAPTPSIALVVKSPQAGYEWTVQSLEQALSSVGAWSPRHAYERQAKKMHIANPMRPKEARRIGEVMGLSHVLFVTVHNKAQDGESKTFADIALVDVHNGNVLVKRSYFLADHRMSIGTATYVADFLALRLNVKRPGDNSAPEESAPADNVASGGRDENFGEMHGRDLDEDIPTPPPAMHSHHHPPKKSSVAFLQGIL